MKQLLSGPKGDVAGGTVGTVIGGLFITLVAGKILVQRISDSGNLVPLPS